MATAFKFVHASDLHLDRPLQGLAGIPKHLKDALANAPYEAARRIFDLAVAEQVDFVLLSGDVFEMERSGPRSVAFLLSQFERLGEHQIAVYWSSGPADHPERWPSSLELPDNVITFTASIVEDVTHRRGQQPIATIFGAGGDPERTETVDFATIDGDVFPIGLTYGEFDPQSMASVAIRYWALGGRHLATREEHGDSVVAYPGTPQGRSPEEAGPRGCYLARVDKHGNLQLQVVETDVIRWSQQHLTIAENAQDAEIQNGLSERALKLSGQATDRSLLVDWQLSTTGPFNPALRRRERCDDLLEWLRDEFGRGSENCLWSTGLTIDPPESLPATWYDEDTILGEYLRAVGRYQSDESLNVTIHEYLPHSSASDELTGWGRVAQQQRDRVLRESALIGVQYLAAHKQPPEESNATAED